ncbi:hypothetical protein KA005_71115, partial [bacterium]|nr:hypothetical protein [bacterium]
RKEDYMGELGAILSGVLDVGLAPTLVVLLLWKGFDFLNKYNKRLYELQIGLQIILNNLNATDEYKEAIRQLKEREHD